MTDRRRVLLRLTGDDPIVPVVNALAELVEIHDALLEDLHEHVLSLLDRVERLECVLELDPPEPPVVDAPDIATYEEART